MTPSEKPALRKGSKSCNELLREGALRLRSAGITEPEQNAQWLLSLAAGIPRLNLLAFSHNIPPRQSAEFFRLIKKKASGLPLAYIAGEQPFMGMSFRISRHVLIPRPETEGLVRLALKILPPKADILEIGTGSGCIACCLAMARPRAQITSCDISARALSVAATNARALGCGVQFIKSDLFTRVKGKFDAIISNPPYVRTGDINAQRELEYEPRAALDGGADGLDCMRKIAARAAGFINPGGFLLLEIGYNQWEAVRRMLAAGGFGKIRAFRDDCGIKRFVMAKI